MTGVIAQCGQIGLCGRKAGHPEPPAAHVFQELFTGDRNMKRIPLTQGKFTVVDDEDYDYLTQWKWHAQKSRNTFYAVRTYAHPTLKTSKGWAKRCALRMHRVILRCPADMQVDHFDHDGLENRKFNIRICTKGQNQHNKLPKPHCASKYKGVNRNQKKWKAQIRHNNVRLYLGTYDSEIVAARVYDNKAKELFGEYAYLNFPKGEPK